MMTMGGYARCRFWVRQLLGRRQGGEPLRRVQAEPENQGGVRQEGLGST